ncbi:6-phosphogluconolactonase [Gordonia araii NBRC 100433]|uniref:6-phosphogluconolactonase n=1 Tax=Gordonia araii NBRC 100433 TaxID=1073574 RepID=G7H0N2_9ACTN|nr:6-phosphogluconolactonase [Gordonia araii]NNG96830.1 6-phosphogluconolactonase [Gordonia araii NBRC 100433]GAB09407.1 6-phosphogluconolactonase [Gordonia araii NBRC 100433]
MPSTPRTDIHPSSAELVEAAADRLIAVIADAQRERGIARVVLTGGSNGIALLELLSGRTDEIDFPALHLYFGDDRFVPADDPDRNVGQARSALLDDPDAAGARIFEMAASDGEYGDDIEAAAAAYGAIVDALEPREDGAVFDVHLLGMGGEGHINSLFPHTPAVAERSASVVAVTDSPKPPPRRITLTLPAVNSSRHVWFLVAGADKADAVAAGVHGADAADWPCAGAHGRVSTVWFLDEKAASKL